MLHAAARGFNRPRGLSGVKFPERMRMRATVALLAGAVLAGASVRLHAQSPEATTSQPRVSTGGEITALVGPSDDRAFFNYTDYDRNALRMIRARLFGEWRPSTD